MEKIYLAIIIIYIVSKIIYGMYKNNYFLNIFSYRNIYVNGLMLTIKKLAPLDFLDNGNMFPLTFFKIEKGKTLWDQMQVDGDEKLTPEQVKEKIKAIKLICEKGVVHWPVGLNNNDFFKSDAPKEAIVFAYKIYAEILQFNFPILKKCYSLKKEAIIHTAELCETFGKKPHDHVSKNKNLSPLESYMIDEFFFNHLQNKKNAHIEKQNNAIKSKRK